MTGSGAAIQLVIDVPPIVRAGEAVPLVLRATNVSEAPIELYLRGRSITCNFIIAAPDGTVVWSSLHGMMIPAIVRIDVLDVQGALEVTAEWDQRSNESVAVEPGEYVVRGELLTEGEPLRTPPFQFRIVSR